MSVEDKKAERMMEESAVIVDGHYEIGMLWKADNLQLQTTETLRSNVSSTLRAVLKGTKHCTRNTKAK